MKILFFNNRKEFHEFLLNNFSDTEGFFIRFDKRKTRDKLTPDEALEEALIFGWIDGLIKSLDEEFYLKYFSPRRQRSIWSERNKALATELIAKGLMAPSGLFQVNLAKADGRWDKTYPEPDDYSLADFSELLKINATAYDRFNRLSPSRKKTFAMSYYTIKSPASRESRLKKIIEILNSSQ
jgi:uncharacterized protein YdeI (YjbR/CyaY-like superfamily)